MDSKLKDKERELAIAEVDDQIESKRASIAEKKAIERKMRKEYGRDWKKILGIFKAIKPDREAIQDLYSINPDLREASRPSGLRKL